MSCHSIVHKKLLLENVLDSNPTDKVLGTESWFKSDHPSTANIPKGFNVYCKDRINKADGDVFILD